MTIAYFDCFAGAAGDMIVAALLDAGVDLEVLRAELGKLALPQCDIQAQKLSRGGLSATKFTVTSEASEQPTRHLSDILSIIDGASLAPRAAERARAIFTRLAQAEAKVHDTSVEHIHFHEVGAVDSIMDIVGACIALEMLGADHVCCSAIPLGSGTVKCEHGTLPIPAPAAAELLVSAKTNDAPLSGEVTTPTGAAILTTLSEGYGPPPAMQLDAVGYGAGSREAGEVPNVLRVMVGRRDADGQTDGVCEISANLDDCTGEVIGATIEALLSAGCLDAWATPIVMKHSRPAWMLSAMCRPGDVERAEQIVLRETTTFGVRKRWLERTRLQRRFETVETPYGPVRMKVGQLGDETLTASPEFADCVSAAEAHHVPAREVLAAAQLEYRRQKARS